MPDRDPSDLKPIQLVDVTKLSDHELLVLWAQGFDVRREAAHRHLTLPPRLVK